MFGHFPELLIVLALGLIVFGPEKLPEIAANAGKMVREMREMVDTAMNPEDHRVPDDQFADYYYESLQRSGEDVPVVEDDLALDTDGEGVWHAAPSSEEDMFSDVEEPVASVGGLDAPADGLDGAHPVDPFGPPDPTASDPAQRVD